MKTIKQLITVMVVALFMMTSFSGKAQKRDQSLSVNENIIFTSTMNYLVENAKPLYKEGMSKEEFLIVTTGKKASLSKEESQLMDAIYYQVSSGNEVYKGNGSAVKDLAKAYKTNPPAATKKWNWGKFFDFVVKIVTILAPLLL